MIGWVLLGVLGASLVVTAGIMIFLGTFDVASFFGVFLPFVGLFAGYTYLRVIASLQEKKVVKKKTFDYCWEAANALLSKMTDGDTLTWSGGKGRESVVQRYPDKQNVMHEFRSMYGFLKRSRQHVIIIWDVENEDIAAYRATPSTKFLENPFADFNPFGKGNGEGWGDRYARDRYGRRIGYRGTSINIGRRRPVVSDEHVRGVVDPFRQQGDGGD